MGFAEFSKTDIIDGFEHGNPDACPRGSFPTTRPMWRSPRIPSPWSTSSTSCSRVTAMGASSKALIAASVGTVNIAGNAQAQGRERLRTALWLIVNSPDYLVER